MSVSKEFLIKNKLYFDERFEFVTSEDYDLWIRLTSKKAKVIDLKKKLAFLEFIMILIQMTLRV